MAKHIFDSGWYHITLCLLVLSVTESQQKTTTLIEIPLTDEEQCMRMMHIPVQSIYQYRTFVNIRDAATKCPSNQRGFQCGAIFSVADYFDALGSVMCIDLEGVGKSLPHNQFAVIASDQSGEVARAYVKSSRFDRTSYSVQCSKEPAELMKVSLRVLDSVKMCPVIWPLMVNHNISLGTVFLKQEVPTRTLMIQACEQVMLEPFEEYSILKVIASGKGSYRYGCVISLRPQVQYKQTEMCFALEYLSPDFSCGVDISVKKGMVEYLSFDLPSLEKSRHGGDEDDDDDDDDDNRKTYCFEYYNAPEDNVYPNLVIRSSIWGCHGKFALEIKYGPISGALGGGGGLNRRNLYMAVFISVIAVCIFIMGLTCLCCLRMRARNRHRNQGLERRVCASPAAPNTGYDGSNVSGDMPAFWTSTSSDQVFGLPSYEEATLGGSLSLPSYSPEVAEKPPAYDTLYSDGGSLPSTSMSSMSVAVLQCPQPEGTSTTSPGPGPGCGDDAPASAPSAPDL